LIVQDPAGRPFNITDPVEPGAQLSAGVIVPTDGAEGTKGGVLRTTFTAPEVQPEAFVTVKL
jgi:hypothetical protein